jgi:hypothetical protein
MNYRGDSKQSFMLATLAGESYLRFGDKEGKVRAKLGLDVNGVPSLEFYDKNEKLTSRMPER